jgi:hypothetical protein
MSYGMRAVRPALAMFAALATAGILVMEIAPVARASGSRRLEACEAFWGERVVIFEGTARSRTMVKRPYSGGMLVEEYGRLTAHTAATLVHFSIDRAWKGIERGRKSIEVLTFASREVWVEDEFDFKDGEQYLVYADPEDDGTIPSKGVAPAVVRTSGLTRTRLLSEANDDLVFLRSLSEPPKGGRVFGTLVARPGPRSLADVLVLLSGAGIARQTRTDERGRYEFDGLGVGVYRVNALPSNDFSNPMLTRIEDRRACSLLDLDASGAGGITGTVVSAAGLPVPNIRVEARVADTQGRLDSWNFWASGLSDDAGRFQIQPGAGGPFVVGVGLRDPAGLLSPYPRTFAPSVSDLARAKVVDFVTGKIVDVGELKLPSPLRDRDVAGTISWADGRPARGIRVWCAEAKNRWPLTYGASDERGRFSLTVPDGVSYYVWAAVDRGDSHVEARTPALVANASVAPLRLVLR